MSEDKQIIIVYGPPNSGKTTWALSQMEEDDIIVDLDRLQSSLCSSPVYSLNPSAHEAAGVLKNAIIEWLAHRTGSWKTAYIIGGYPRRSVRQGLQRKLGADLHLMEADVDTCVGREPKNAAYPECIYQWFEDYEPDWSGSYSRCNPKAQAFYDSTEWKRLRAEVLELDHHECVMCREQGRYTRATIVHHVKPLEDRWDLRASIHDEDGSRQLISVCADCHAKCHPGRGMGGGGAKPMTEERW